MQVLKTRFFTRWARKERISDSMLLAAAQEIRDGLVGAVLGVGLVKKRVARPGGGKRSGYRMLIAIRGSERCVFLYGFAKNERDSVDGTELGGLKRLSQFYLGMDGESIERSLKAGELTEVENGESATA